MLASLTYRREDGTFVGVVGGHPYHVIPSDPLFSEAQAIADGMGDALPFEPPPPAAPPPPPPPTRAELMARLDAIAAQIAALGEE